MNLESTSHQWEGGTSSVRFDGLRLVVDNKRDAA
jgi:hypothetical protein